VICDPTQRTGFQFKGRVTDGSDPPVEYHRKGSAASQMGPADVDEAWLRSARHLHATGVFAAISDTSLQAALKTLDVMRAAGRTISFDTNLRPTLWSSTETMRHWINELASRADWVLPGIEEGLLLTGHSAARRRGALLPRARCEAGGGEARGRGRLLRQRRGRHRPRRRLPGEGSDRHRGRGRRLRGRRGQCLLEGKSVPEAVRRGAWIGARAVQVLGDTEGLPTRAELEEAGL
jgi:dehydrogluconokinase